MNMAYVIRGDWAMPDAQAKEVSVALRKKSIRPEDRVQEALVEIAKDIVILEPDPKDWGWWVSNLLEQMGAKAGRKRKSPDFSKMLSSLSNNLAKYKE